jgi:Holliday junction resolvase RusA-like endonuclease
MIEAARAELPGSNPVISPKLFCAIELTGQPIGKGRPRFTRTKSGRPIVYTPAETRAYERDLAWAAKLAMGAREPTRLPVALSVEAYLELPSSWNRAKREAALAGTLLPTGRPDADNLLKIAADALRGIVLGDDAAIVDASVSKRYSDDPRLRLEVREFAC